MTISQQLLAIQQQITSYEKKYHRPTHHVKLLAVSKGQSIEKIKEAVTAGQFSFGENYLQEALPKIEALRAFSLEWHFIGSIQANKTKKIAEHFSWVQSVASAKIAKRLSEQRPDHLPPLNICIEVNISGEKNKSGIASEEVLALATYCHTLPCLALRGLMAIPAHQTDFAAQRDAFRKLHTLFITLQQAGIALDTLSMGMTHDFEAAIAEGATLIRIGTGIFGSRSSL